MNIMPEFPIRMEAITDVYAAGLTWLAGTESTVDTPESLPGIDLGHGRTLSAADVVESHFERLTHNSPTEESARFSVSSLSTAIDNLAPHLLPMIQVAEAVADAHPPARASTQFRSLLNEALVAERKQQINKQAIGIQPSDEENDLLEKIVENRYTLMASLPVAATLALSLWYLNRPKESLSSNPN